MEVELNAIAERDEVTKSGDDDITFEDYADKLQEDRGAEECEVEKLREVEEIRKLYSTEGAHFLADPQAAIQK